MYKIAFVILHFKTIEDTCRCVESIYQVNYENKGIVIVDNGSCDGSREEIQKRYENSTCHILISKKNRGFTKGNNIGFRYAKKILKADFIVLLNNDTYLEQPEFANILVEKYLEK